MLDEARTDICHWVANAKTDEHFWKKLLMLVLNQRRVEVQTAIMRRPQVRREGKGDTDEAKLLDYQTRVNPGELNYRGLITDVLLCLDDDYNGEPEETTVEICKAFGVDLKQIERRLASEQKPDKTIKPNPVKHERCHPNGMPVRTKAKKKGKK